jgi:hypothetical protein
MTDRTQRPKRRRMDQTYAIQSSFNGVGAQLDDYQTRPPQHSSHDRPLYLETGNHSRQPNETFGTPHGWYNGRPGHIPSHTDLGGESMQRPWHHAGHPPFVERYPRDLVSPNNQSQNMAYGPEGVFDFQRYGGTQPQPHPPLPQTIDTNLPSPENGPDMYLRSRSASAGQSATAELSEDSIALSPFMEADPYDNGDPGSLDLDCLNQMSNVQSNAVPWSSFIPSEIPQVPRYHASQCAGRTAASNATQSTYEYVSSNSSYVVIDSPATAFSQSDIQNNGMGNSMVTARPAYGITPEFSSYNQTSVAPDLLVQPATPPIGISSTGPYFGQTQAQYVLAWFLRLRIPNDHSLAEFDDDLRLPRMERRGSETLSYTSDASSAATPHEVDCDVIGCTVSFRGLYAKGNLARHKRHYHNGPRVYVCADELCDRVFKRQDARLKHYRKHHPILALTSPYIARNSRTRPTERERDLALSNVSTWT